MAGYNGRARFTATVRAEPGEVPPRFWRLIGLLYPNGRRLSIVHMAEPADGSELPGLMWTLQRAAWTYGFTITLTNADGITSQVPPIPSRPCREGAR